MRLVFFGSGEFGLPSFAHLARGHEVAAVVSQPDRPAGRRRQLTPTPVAAWAQTQGIDPHRVEDVNTDPFVDGIAALRADAAVVIAFGQKLSDRLIGGAGRLVVNLHASLLPRFRGAAPINHAILAGDAQTGVSVISLASRMDAGLIYAQAQTPIGPAETAGELHDRLALLGPAVLEQVLADFAAGHLVGRPQDESRATRAPKLSRADGGVDFTRPAAEVAARIRGLSPWPGVTVQWRSEDHPCPPVALKLLRAVAGPASGRTGPDAPAPGMVMDIGDGLRVAAGDGTVDILELQPPGKRPMAADAFCRGHGMRVGDRLSSV